MRLRAAPRRRRVAHLAAWGHCRGRGIAVAAWAASLIMMAAGRLGEGEGGAKGVLECHELKECHEHKVAGASARSTP